MINIVNGNGRASAHFQTDFFSDSVDVDDVLPDLTDALAEAGCIVKEDRAILIPDIVAVAHDYSGHSWLMNRPFRESVEKIDCPLDMAMCQADADAAEYLCCGVKFYDPEMSGAEQLVCSIERQLVLFSLSNWKLRFLDTSTKELLAVIKILFDNDRQRFIEPNKHVELYKLYRIANRCQIVKA